MKVHVYYNEQQLPVTIDKAWEFFSSAKNLAVITPPELEFKILTKLNDNEIYEGMLIDYTVKPLLGVPLRWQTQISIVQEPFLFVDIQLKGPYKLWRHTHTFTENENGVFMSDKVEYSLPFGFIGNIMLPLVKNKIEQIFDFRKKVLEQLF